MKNYLLMGMGIGDWGLGPIPNPHFPNPQFSIYFFKKFYFLKNILNKIIKNINNGC